MKQKTNKKYCKKHYSKTSYCPNCQQKKSCGVLNKEKTYCCSCYRKLLEELEWEQLLISSAQELLNSYRQRKVICSCLESEKPRVKYNNFSGSGWSNCERCEKRVEGAGHHGIVKNRNNPSFWGIIESKWRVLCLECLGKKYLGEMSRSKRKTYQKYLKRGYQ